MNKTTNKYWVVATTALASLFISCASDSSGDKSSQENGDPRPAASGSSSFSDSDVASTEAQLRAARASAGAAKSDAKSCFEKLSTCKGDAGTIDQACLDQLQGCLPKGPPAPVDCPKIPDLTPEQVTAIDDAVGQADDLAGDAIDFAGGIIDALLDGGISFPDGGIPFPVGNGGQGGGSQGGQGGRPNMNKGRGDAGLPTVPQAPSFPHGDAGVATRPHADAQVPGFPAIDPDASIGGGELCGVPLPVVPIGALKACADKAAADLKGGQDPVAVATSALSCIEAPFHDDIAKLCGEAKTECAKAGAPPNICGNVNDICSALSP